MPIPSLGKGMQMFYLCCGSVNLLDVVVHPEVGHGQPVGGEGPRLVGEDNGGRAKSLHGLAYK